MTIAFRLMAIVIAIAAAVDPALARRVTVPLPVDVLLPRPSDPSSERANKVRDQIASVLAGRVDLAGREAPQAFIAIGGAVLPPSTSAPVFVMPVAETPAVSISEARVPDVILGQSAPVVATLHGTGLKGRTTTIALVRDGTSLESVQHQWKNDDETFVARLGFVPAATGVHRVRVTAVTDGLDSITSADVATAVRDRRLRVLAYEARPSWPLTFARRSLEPEPIFDVTATARTTTRSATTSAGAPASLAALQVDRFDAIMVGAPEALSSAEIRSLDAFVSRRGGALVLFPDRALSRNVRGAFGLPEFDELILDRPLTTGTPGPAIRASELLIPRGDGLERLGAVRHDGADRVVAGSLMRGAGRIIVSGAMDAWRYRADPQVAFDDFWRSLVADAAAEAPPRIAVRVEPSIARPGDELLVSVTVRPTEFDDGAASVLVPAITASLNAAEGGGESIRLWPGVTPGTFEGRTRAPRPGTYTASVAVPGASADAALTVADDIVHAASRSDREAAFVAAASGGAVVTNVDDLARRLDALQPQPVEQRTWPMRSPWWILPFTGLLCAEWALRRRGGRR